MSGAISQIPATPGFGDINDDNAYDLLPEEVKDQKILESYLKSLPYTCESTNEMEDKLKAIVEKIAVCVQTNSWSSIIAWDHMLQ